MTIKQLEKEIARREGKKFQVSIGNIREIVGILSDIFYEDAIEATTFLTMHKNGQKRANKKKGKKK